VQRRERAIADVMKKIGAGCVNNGFLTALEGREIARIKRCPVCARFFLVKPSHKSACRPGCLTVIKQRRFITTSASSGRTETQASQRSRTFLRNHAEGIVAIDVFVVVRILSAALPDDHAGPRSQEGRRIGRPSVKLSLVFVRKASSFPKGALILPNFPFQSYGTRFAPLQSRD
jgi:hypothetical protein